MLLDVRTWSTYLLSILLRNHTWELHCYAATAAAAINDNNDDEDDDEDNNDDDNNDDDDGNDDDNTLLIFIYIWLSPLPKPSVTSLMMPQGGFGDF